VGVIVLDLGARRPESPQTADPDSVRFQPRCTPSSAYPHVVMPTQDTTDEQDLEIVDVGMSLTWTLT